MMSEAAAADEAIAPMVPVPEALRAVLREAARIAVERWWATALSAGSVESNANALFESVVDTPTISGGPSPLLGRTLATPVDMPPPGYPPYRASVMDGYAVSTQTPTPTPTPTSDPAAAVAGQLVFRVAGRVVAGDSPTTFSASTPTPTSTPSKESVSGTPAPPLPVAYYVTTGARVPDGCDCVVPVEDVDLMKQEGEEEHGTTATLSLSTLVRLRDTAILQPGKWIRPIGFDLPAQSQVLPAGTIVDAAALGLLLQAGCSHRASVLKRITVGVLSTGNELLPDTHNAGGWLTQGNVDACIPDVNRPVLRHLLQSWNNTCRILDLGQARDDDDVALERALRHACETCDVVITTGGISRGETDRLEAVLQSLHATIHFGRLHMKPGKPTTLATIRRTSGGGGGGDGGDGDGSNRSNHDAIVFCLPGNPVSAIVCAQLLVRPCLELLYRAPLFLSSPESPTPASSEDSDDSQVRQQQWLLDTAPVLHAEVGVVLQFDAASDQERPEYHRVRLVPPEAATGSSRRFEAHSTGIQQSSRLASMRGATALAMLPQGTRQKPKVLRGEEFDALLLHDNPLYPLLRWSESRHVRGTPLHGEPTAATEPVPTLPPTNARGGGRSFDVGVVVLHATAASSVEPPTGDASIAAQVVQAALSGSRSGAVTATSCRVLDHPVDRDPEIVWQDDVLGGMRELPSWDVLILAHRGPWTAQLKLASHLRTRLRKLADSIALQARRGAASKAPIAALSEVVVGLFDASGDAPLDSNRGERLVLLLPWEGLSAALENVRGLVKHALEVARQVPTPPH